MQEESSFLVELASSAPTPGGGGASAYCGALATALASMVGNLTVGKKRYQDVEADVTQALLELEQLRSSLMALIERDAQAFGRLAQSWKMPASNPYEQKAKHEAEQEALVNACEVPLQIMADCAKAIVLCEFMARNGSRMALSDAGVAARVAQAALEGASLNILINAKSFDDRARAQEFLDKQQALIDRYAPMAEETYSYVRNQVAR